MNRDAKIGVVVILIIVGLLVIIWGRGEPKPNEALPGERDGGLHPARLDTGPSRAGATLLDPLAAESRGTSAAAGSEGAAGSAGAAGIPAGSAYPVNPDSPSPSPGPMPASVGSSAAPAAAGPASSPPVVVPSASVARTWDYTVREEDIGLEKIARDQLGDPNRWKQIADLNGLPKPYRILVGQKLKMPAKGGSAAATVASASVVREPAGAAPAAGRRTYTVREGDTMIQIAREQLGDPRRWREIADANHMAEPYQIKPGQQLTLPK